MSCPDENILQKLLSVASLTAQDALTILKIYGLQYLPSPRRSSAMEKLFIDVIKMNPPEKLALLEMALDVRMEVITLENALRAASLSIQECRDFVDRYGTQFLPPHLTSSSLKECIWKYLQTLTFDDLEQPATKDFLLFLHDHAPAFPSDRSLRIQSWYEINSFMEQPDMAKWKPFLMAINSLSFETRSSLSGKFIERLARALTFCAKDAADLKSLIPAISSVLQLDKLQLLYEMAYCAGQRYGKDKEALLLPYIQFAPHVEEACKVVLPRGEKNPKYMNYIVTTLFNNLLLEANQTTFEYIAILTQAESEKDMVLWHEYLAPYGTLKQKSSGPVVALYSWLGAIRGFFVYWYAVFRMMWVLTFSRRIKDIVEVGKKYEPLFEKHPEGIAKDRRIELAYEFLMACENNDDYAFVKCADEIENKRFHRLTEEETQRIQEAGERIRIANEKRPSGPLSYMEQGHRQQMSPGNEKVPSGPQSMQPPEPDMHARPLFKLPFGNLPRKSNQPGNDPDSRGWKR